MIAAGQSHLGHWRGGQVAAAGLDVTVENAGEEVTLGLNLQGIKYKSVTNFSHVSALLTPFVPSWELTV